MAHKDLMKKCQKGTNNLNKANNLLAQCYGTIGLLLNEIEAMGERNGECTMGVTGDICENCGCGYAAQAK